MPEKNNRLCDLARSANAFAFVFGWAIAIVTMCLVVVAFFHPHSYKVILWQYITEELGFCVIWIIMGVWLGTYGANKSATKESEVA